MAPSFSSKKQETQETSVEQLSKDQETQETSAKHALMDQETQETQETPVEQVLSNQDLVTKILLRLPIECVLKFRVISRKWLKIISSHCFFQCYTHLHEKNGFLKPNGIFLDCKHHFLPEIPTIPLEENVEVTFPRIDDGTENGYVITQSCNGLFLCAQFNVKKWIVCNPITKKMKRIHGPDKYTHIALSLAFNPFKSSFYKILAVRKSSDGSGVHADLYRSETESWDTLVASFVGEVSKIDFFSPTYLSGKIFWFCYGTEMLSFNIDEEIFEILSMPKLPDGKEWGYLTESGESLYLIATNDALAFDIYEMVSNDFCWILKQSIDLEEKYIQQRQISIWLVEPIRMNMCDGLCVIGSEKEEEFKIVVISGFQVMEYNFKSGRLTWLPELYRFPEVGYCLSIGCFKFYKTLSCV